MQAIVFKHRTLQRVAKPLAEVWVMIHTHKLHCYQLAQLVWSILTTQAGVNHKSCMCEWVHVFRGISKSFVCQNQPSCGSALLLVYQSSRGKTVVCKMRGFHCGITGNISALVRATRGTETLPSGRQNKNMSWEWKGIHWSSTGGIHAGFTRTSEGGEFVKWIKLSSNQAVVGLT